MILCNVKRQVDSGRNLNADDYKTDCLYVTFQTPVQDQRSCLVRAEQGFKYALCTSTQGIKWL